MIKHTFLKFILLIGLISFLLHFVWEWFQCVPFFVHRATQASPISMVVAAFGDVGLTYLVLSFVCIVVKEKRNLMQNKITMKTFILIEIFALLVAVGTEKFALATNRWSYTSLNPIIPFIEVSSLPVLQLMILIPVALFLAVALLKKVFII